MSSQELPRVLQLLWDREPARPGPKPRHRIGDIAAAAVRVADADGLTAVSMGAVAAELGVTTMALYRYVDSKAELYTAMRDAAYGPPPRGRPSGGWRRQLEAWAAANRAALLSHPWIVQIAVTEPPLTPNMLRWMERGIRAFAETALTQQQRLSSLLLIEVYVRGQVLLSSQLGASAEQSPLTRREADARYVRRLAELIDETSFPGVHAALASGSLADEGEVGDFADEEFRFGLQTVLDGIQARVERRRRTAR